MASAVDGSHLGLVMGGVRRIPGPGPAKRSAWAERRGMMDTADQIRSGSLYPVRGVVWL